VTPQPTDFAGLLKRLLDASVEFIVIGGVAGNVHGSAPRSGEESACGPRRTRPLRSVDLGSRGEALYFLFRIEYSLCCVLISNLSPTIAGVAIEKSSSEFVRTSLYSLPASIT